MQLVEHSETSRQQQAMSLDRRLVMQLLRFLGDPPVRFLLWSGEAVTTVEPSVLTLRIADRMTLLRLLLDPQMQFGEAFTAGRIECVDGDLVRGLEAVFRRVPAISDPNSLSARLARLQRFVRRNSLSGSRRNIQQHYDLGNDFYRLWLDPTMAYTCAYFPSENATLHEAQVAKMDHVCRKLRLRPGDEVIEAGCGWGSLAMHMARRYGVKVRAYNISSEQITFARQQAAHAKLLDKVEFVHDDYRNAQGRCDVFVSVGMLEHVGMENYRLLGKVIRACLKPSGRGLIHSIGRDTPQPINRWIERYIFPGASIPSLGEMTQIFEPAGFSVLDVENLRLHYARTLGCWLQAFENSRDRIANMFDARFVRMWRMYLASSQAAFLAGEMQLFQVLFAPTGNNNVALTREHLYRSDEVS